MSKAVINVNSRQYVVKKGSKIQCDYLKGEEGSKIEIPMIGRFRDVNKTGIAYGTILKHYLGEKRVVIHKSPRGHDRHRTGSRPRLTLLQIDMIEGDE